MKKAIISLVLLSLVLLVGCREYDPLTEDATRWFCENRGMEHSQYIDETPLYYAKICCSNHPYDGEIATKDCFRVNQKDTQEAYYEYIYEQRLT